MKIGFEVEGRYKGLYTLFMKADEALDFFAYRSLKQRASRSIDDKIEKVRHIYISDHENILRPADTCLQKWDELGLPVTIEVTRVNSWRAVFTKNVHLMLAVVDGDFLTNTSFWNLLPTDQIKFSSPKGPAHMVYCVTKENMSVTKPEDFDGDFEFEALCDDKFRT